MLFYAYIRHFFSVDPNTLTEKQFWGYHNRINDLLEIGIDLRGKGNELAKMNHDRRLRDRKIYNT